MAASRCGAQLYVCDHEWAGVIGMHGACAHITRGGVRTAHASGSIELGRGGPRAELPVIHAMAMAVGSTDRAASARGKWGMLGRRPFQGRRQSRVILDPLKFKFKWSRAAPRTADCAHVNCAKAG